MRPSALHIDIETEASPAWLAFAGAVTFGTGGERYRRLHLDQQVRRFADPVFLSVREGQELLGIYVLDKRRLQTAGRPLTGFYRALFAVREDRRGQGVGAALAREAMDWLDAAARVAGAPVLSFGCIAADNGASLAVLAGQGGLSLGSLTSRLLYRQWPRASARLVEVLATPAPTLNAAATLDITTCDLPRYGFVDADADGDADGDGVDDAESKGKGKGNNGVGAEAGAAVRISAHIGVSAIAMADTGPGARLAVRLLVRPWQFTRRRFDPESLAYLRISHLYVRPGCAADAPAFLDALLARYGVNYALLVINSDSPLEAMLTQVGLFDSGIARAFLPAPQRLQIMGRWHGRSDASESMTGHGGEYQLMPVDL